MGDETEQERNARYRQLAERLELERIEDLDRAAKLLTDRALERLTIALDSGNHDRARVLSTHARILLEAAAAVLQRI